MFLTIGIISVVFLLVIFVLLIANRGMNGYGRGVIGTVTAINGTTITLKSKVRSNREATTYTIDASSAIITKNSKTSTELGIAVGDTVIVKGTISGIIFTAKTIKDRTPPPKVPPPKDTKIF